MFQSCRASFARRRSICIPLLHHHAFKRVPSSPFLAVFLSWTIQFMVHSGMSQSGKMPTAMIRLTGRWVFGSGWPRSHGVFHLSSENIVVAAIRENGDKMLMRCRPQTKVNYAQNEEHESEELIQLMKKHRICPNIYFYRLNYLKIKYEHVWDT